MNKYKAKLNAMTPDERLLRAIFGGTRLFTLAKMKRKLNKKWIKYAVRTELCVQITDEFHNKIWIPKEI